MIFSERELLQIGVDWDEEHQPVERGKWEVLFKEMKELNDIEFPRSLTSANAKEPSCYVYFLTHPKMPLELVLTADRESVMKNTKSGSLPPLKQLSIPRLELQEAVLASRLAKSI